MSRAFTKLLRDVRACRICEPELALGARPVLQVDPRARVLIAGQAPGRRVHASGVPFDDPSGERLRAWMGIARAEFYDPRKIAILPMGFCYPGTGSSGDLPPRPECAAEWRDRLLGQLDRIELTLVIGKYALDWHLGASPGSLTERVKAWKQHRPRHVPMPHPSPRNNRWLKQNPWFERDVVPYVRRRVRAALRDAGRGRGMRCGRSGQGRAVFSDPSVGRSARRSRPVVGRGPAC